MVVEDGMSIVGMQGGRSMNVDRMRMIVWIHLRIDRGMGQGSRSMNVGRTDLNGIRLDLVIRT
jgi:hypothetical protein